MMQKIIGKIVKLTVLFAIMIAIGLAFWKGARWSLGFLAAAAWALVNFTLTVGLLDMALMKMPKRQLGLFLFIKFPVLYLTGFAVLVSQLFPIMSILTGLVASTAIIGIVKLCQKKA